MIFIISLCAVFVACVIFRHWIYINFGLQPESIAFVFGVVILIYWFVRFASAIGEWSAYWP